MFPNLVKKLLDQPVYKEIKFKADPHTTVVLKLNNTKQFVSITDGITTKSIYGRLTLKGQPLYKVNTPDSIKGALARLEDNYMTVQATDRETCYCRVCGKLLTDPASVADGIGPECANGEW